MEFGDEAIVGRGKTNSDGELCLGKRKAQSGENDHGMAFNSKRITIIATIKTVS